MFLWLGQQKENRMHLRMNKALFRWNKPKKSDTEISPSLPTSFSLHAFNMPLQECRMFFLILLSMVLQVRTDAEQVVVV